MGEYPKTPALFGYAQILQLSLWYIAPTTVIIFIINLITFGGTMTSNQILIKQYFKAWEEANEDDIASTIHENIYYNECYGPIYNGKNAVLKWFREWNKVGKVYKWTILHINEQGNTAFVQWRFICKYSDNIDGFDGVSKIRCEDNKIISVEEFSSKPIHHYPNNNNVIRPYDSSWVTQFQILKVILSEGTSNLIDSIEHVGSTSIPEMWAKPIIDIDIILKPQVTIDDISKALSKLGYIHVGDQGIKGREVFKLSEAFYKIQEEIKHHLYVCSRESKELKRHIKFRDTLRAEKNLRDQYNAIKKEILDKVGWDNRPDYVIMKEEHYRSFFDDILK